MLIIPNILEKVGIDENVECKNLYVIQYQVKNINTLNSNNNTTINGVALVQAINNYDAERTFKTQSQYNNSNIVITSVQKINLKVTSSLLFEFTF